MKRVLLALPHDFVQALDAIAKRDNTTRSEVIRDSIRGRLRWEWEQQQKRGGEPDPPSL
jgi:metal-responsive CopG/Arc/MetJ family transcriptional regulator